MTQQVLTQENLAQAQRLLLAQFEEVSVGIATLSAHELTFLSVNTLYSELVGRPAQQLIGKSLLEAIPELRGQGFDTLLQQVIESGQPYQAREVGAQLHRQGQTQTAFFDFTYQPLRDADGRISGVMVVGFEVTRQVLARQGLEENRNSLQNAVDVGGLGTFSVDISTGLLTCSARVAGWFGFDTLTADTEAFIQGVGSDERDYVRQHLVETIQLGDAGRYDVTHSIINAKTGQQTLIHALGRVYFDVRGQPLKMEGIAQDITAQRKLQTTLEHQVRQRTQELERAQRRIQQTADDLQSILDTSPAAVGLFRAVHDQHNSQRIIDFRLAVGNQKMAQLFDLPLAELVGQSAQQVSSRLWGEQTLSVLRQVYADQQYQYLESQWSAPPGQDHWMAIDLTPQADGVVLTGLDISELKRMQTQQQQWLSELETTRTKAETLSMLQASVQARREMMRSFSHDLRSNLSLIMGGLSTLNQANSAYERTYLMNMLLRNVGRANSLLTDLLDLARLETGQLQRTNAVFDAAQLLQDLEQSIRSMADERHIQLETKGPAPLPVETDRQLVYRLVQNLLLNALKYTPRRGKIKLDWGQNEAEWWVRVIDTGPGLAPSLVARLNGTVSFSDDSPSSLETVNSTTKSHFDEGVLGLPSEGIGLRIVEEVARLLEARLQVSSEPDQGTTFVTFFSLS